MKIRPVRAELFPADGRLTDVKKQTLAFHNFAKAPKNDWLNTVRQSAGYQKGTGCGVYVRSSYLKLSITSAISQNPTNQLVNELITYERKRHYITVRLSYRPNYGTMIRVLGIWISQPLKYTCTNINKELRPYQTGTLTNQLYSNNQIRTKAWKM
jgi:hypothetical protein